MTAAATLISIVIRVSYSLIKDCITFVIRDRWRRRLDIVVVVIDALIWLRMHVVLDDSYVSTALRAHSCRLLFPFILIVVSAPLMGVSLALRVRFSLFTMAFAPMIGVWWRAIFRRFMSVRSVGPFILFPPPWFACGLNCSCDRLGLLCEGKWVSDLADEVAGDCLAGCEDLKAWVIRSLREGCLKTYRSSILEELELLCD